MNINQLVKQAKIMKNIQEEFAKKEFKGQSGGGVVSIIISGSGRIEKICIDTSLFKTENKEILEDLIIAAHNDAKSKADQESKNTILGSVTNLPF